jgi:hypothetical protein
VQDFEVRETVDVTEHPELKAQLLSGALLRWVCAKCGADSDVIYPLLYHDQDCRLLFWLIPGDGQPGDQDPKLKTLDPGLAVTHQLRLVRTANDLKEKVVIADAGLDDRVLELFKALMREDPETQLRPGDTVLFAGLAEEDAVAVLVFTVLRGREQCEFSVPFDLFSRFAEEAESLAESLFAGTDPWMVVDEQTATRRILERKSGK